MTLLPETPKLSSWVVKALVGAILGVVIPFFFAPGPYKAAWIWVQAAVRPAPAHDKFIVLLADLSGDDSDATHRKYLANVLTDMGGVRVISIGKTLGNDPDVGDQTESRTKTIREAQALLENDDADILVWGRYYKNSFQLGFVPKRQQTGRMARLRLRIMGATR